MQRSCHWKRDFPHFCGNAFSALQLCFFSRDLIKVFKWYVDRIVDAEHQDHIQQVLKVRPLAHHAALERTIKEPISFLWLPPLLVYLPSTRQSL